MQLQVSRLPVLHVSTGGIASSASLNMQKPNSVIFLPQRFLAQIATNLCRNMSGANYYQGPSWISSWLAAWSVRSLLPRICLLVRRPTAPCESSFVARIVLLGFDVHCVKNSRVFDVARSHTMSGRHVINMHRGLVASRQATMRAACEYGWRRLARNNVRRVRWQSPKMILASKRHSMQNAIRCCADAVELSSVLSAWLFCRTAFLADAQSMPMGLSTLTPVA